MHVHIFLYIDICIDWTDLDEDEKAVFLSSNLHVTFKDTLEQKYLFNLNWCPHFQRCTIKAQAFCFLKWERKIIMKHQQMKSISKINVSTISTKLFLFLYPLINTSQHHHHHRCCLSILYFVRFYLYLFSSKALHHIRFNLSIFAHALWLPFVLFIN